MEWLQRYVDNVRTYLPAQLREDVGNELYSDLQDQCEELEVTLGRAPTEHEVLALLKERGHPMAVAAGYCPRRVLVSEPLFPLYLQVLKWALTVLAVLGGIGEIFSLVSQANPNFVGAAIRWLGGLYESGIHVFAWVTLGFYLAGESLGYRKVFANWDPRSLPKIADGGRRIRRFDSVVEFVATLIALAWLNDIWKFSDTVGGLRFSPEFDAVLPWLNVALGLSVLMSLVKLLFPYWTQRRLLTDIAVNTYWLVLLAVLMSLYPPFSWVWQGEEAWQPTPAGWRTAVAITMAVSGWDLLKNLRMLLRERALPRAL